MAAYEVAHLTEQLDAESPAPVAPRRRGKWLVVGVGLALVIAGCMGVAVGMARARKPASPLEHLSTIRNKLVKAFSSRALLENVDFESTGTLVWNEEGAEDPSAMGVKAVIKQSTDERDGITIKITFLAQEGKGADLVKKLKGIWSAVVESARGPDGPGDEFADGLENTAKISAGEADDEALIEVALPAADNRQQMEDDLKSSLDGHTEYETSVFVGRSIQEMYEHKHTNIALLPKGIKYSSHEKMSSAFFDVIQDGMDDAVGHGPLGGVDPDMVKTAINMAKNLAKWNMNQELYYKSTDKLDGAFDEIFPNIGGAIHMMAQTFFEPMPSTVRGNLTGIEAVADGVKSLQVLGLPNKWEVEATFTNFHVAPLIADCLAEFPSEPESE